MLTIQDLLNDKRVFLDVPAADKLAALKTVVHLLAEAGQINADAEADLYRRLDEREQLSTTALGEGIGNQEIHGNATSHHHDSRTR